MTRELAAAILAGFSLSSFGCGFFAVGMGAVEERLAYSFIISRILGILCISALISLGGLWLHIPRPYLMLSFGALSAALGAVFVFRRHQPGRGCRAFGGLMGFFRGAMPCQKILLITPLLLNRSLSSALAISLCFAVASSAYPLIGLGLLRYLHGFHRFHGRIQFAGSIVLLAMGLYWVLQGVLALG